MYMLNICVCVGGRFGFSSVCRSYHRPLHQLPSIIKKAYRPLCLEPSVELSKVKSA